MNFKFCPNCGSPVENAQNLTETFDENLTEPSPLRFDCAKCQHVRYQNVASTASMLLMCGDELLFCVRGREPSKDLLDFPGGFVDTNESLEDAFVREMEEELNWVPEQFQYAFSFPNIYNYQSVRYHTCDAFYYAQVDEKPLLQANDDVASLIWLSIADIDSSRFGFDSVHRAFEQLKQALQIS